MFYRLVSWRRIRSATLVAAWSGDSRRAKCHPGESENRKFFESLVHNAPPFFFCFVMRTFAAYKGIGMMGWKF